MDVPDPGLRVNLANIRIDEAAKKAGKIDVQLNSPVSLPGIAIPILFRNEWKGADPRNAAPFTGSSGVYEVTFVLRQLGSVVDESDFASVNGDSYIWLPEAGNPPRTDRPVLLLQHGSAPAGVLFEGFSNAQGRLGMLVAKNVRADDFEKAELKANHAVQALLSQLSVRFNFPVIIAKTKVVETATANQRLEVTTPFGVQKLGQLGTVMPVAGFEVYASLYREALNSNSPVYRFLCFYKIIEGLRIRRNRLASERTQKGESPTRQRELLPSDSASARTWLRDIFELPPGPDEMNVAFVFPPNTFGQRVNRIIERVLTPLRVGIAHAVLDTGETTLVAHELLHMRQIRTWLPLINCIARLMLRTDFPEAFTPPGVR
jgi:hypothetical protein